MESPNSGLRSPVGTLSSLSERASAPKFQRSESVQTDSDHESVRHADLWFLDGSVVLKAENTLFRVHISQLSRHSAFFRDLFSLPQPPNCRPPMTNSSKCVLDGTHLDGCSVVYLHDTAEDVGNLLTALYDGPYVYFFSKPHGQFRLTFCLGVLAAMINMTSGRSLEFCAYRRNTYVTRCELKLWRI
jgi:hypothetical protein